MRPAASPGWSTCSAFTYVATEDVDGLYERVRLKGADVIMEIQDTDYGSRDFAVRDPEGNVWSFGTYRPSV